MTTYTLPAIDQDTIIHSWEQWFSDSLGCGHSAGIAPVASGLEPTETIIQVIDNGDPDTLNIREIGSHGFVNRTITVLRARALENLDALRTGHLPYSLVTVKTVQPQEIARRWSGVKNVVIGDGTGGTWLEDVLDLMDLEAPARLRTVDSGGGTVIVFVDTRDHVHLFHGDAKQLAEVGLIRYAEVLEPYRATAPEAAPAEL
jgi:hypothetical protein